MWSYIRNYIIIALALYGISNIKYFLQINLSWHLWNICKTTNLFIMYYIERFYARTKKILYNVPMINTNSTYITDIKDKIDIYGLKRDKLYYEVMQLFNNIKNIFGINRHNKRNYFSIVLTILFTKRATLMKLMIGVYNKALKHKIIVIVHKMYEFIKRINPNTIKKLGVLIVGAIVILSMAKIAQRFWNKHVKTTKIIEKENLIQSQQELFDILNVLQNKLGDYVIVIVNKVRAIDKLLVKQDFKEYKELAVQVVKDITICEEVIEEIKNKISDVEQMKEVEVYGVYHAKYSIHTLTLIDLSKVSYGKEVLERYQEHITDEKAVYDEELVAQAREYLYDYLKKCISYYNELEVYLSKLNRGKTRAAKKIYMREQMQDMKGPEEVIENYFYSNL